MRKHLHRDYNVFASISLELTMEKFHAVRLGQILSQLILIQEINYLSLKGNNLLTVVEIHNESCRQG